MILVDTSIWVDHLRRREDGLAGLLDSGEVLMHVFVIGEIACGSLARRAEILELLHALPAAQVAEPDEVLLFVERRGLGGRGIGYLDSHLLASAALSPGTALWTRDKRLRAVAAAIELAFDGGRLH